jgi:hypothetical protein
MRMPGSRAAVLVVLAAISALLLGGCQLREGASSEYGDTQSMPTPTSTVETGRF